MDTVVSLLGQAPNWIADRIGELFDAPFWQVIAGVVIATLSLVAFSGLPGGGRDRVKLAALLGALGLAAFDLVRTLEPGFSLG